MCCDACIVVLPEAVGRRVNTRSSQRPDDDDRCCPVDAGTGNGGFDWFDHRGNDSLEAQSHTRRRRGCDGTGGEITRRSGAENRWRQDARKIGVDFGEFEIDAHTTATSVEVFLNPTGVAAGQAFANMGAEAFGRPAAVTCCRVGEMVLEVGLTQAFARPVGEGGDAVGAHTQERCDLGRFLALHIQVPKNELPALG